MTRAQPRYELPDSTLERTFFAEGARYVAGIDEVGRGAWAGPVSVGVAVVSLPALAALPSGVADSKLLTPAQREALFDPLARAVVAYAVGHASPLECDELGMTAAQRLATARALEELDVRPDATIVDGRTDFTAIPGARTVIGADRRCVAVAAASVLAKVTRDRIMTELSASYEPYRFASNKGYPSPEHRSALDRHGLSELHRASWSFALDYRSESSPDRSSDSGYNG